MARKSPAQHAVARQDVRALPSARGLPGCRCVPAHHRAGLRRARHLTRDRAAPAVVTNGGKGEFEFARILTFSTEPPYITGRTGHQAAAV